MTLIGHRTRGNDSLIDRELHAEAIKTMNEAKSLRRRVCRLLAALQSHVGKGGDARAREQVRQRRCCSRCRPQ